MNIEAGTPIDIEHLSGWVGRTAQAEETLAPFAARALAGLLDSAPAPGEGDALPLPWHWLYFLDAPAHAATGVDGHPQRGGFLPPVALPRRMWAAGRLWSEASLLIGQPAQKLSTIRSVDLKHGKTGPLVFVRVEHQLHQAGRLCLREEQDIVYREAPQAATPLPPGERATGEAGWSRVVVPDPVLLFRYSALTYNGHRIHYDRDYATSQEFYPALVVHGPLLATLLLDLLRRERPLAVVREFSFRAQRPAFDTGAIRLCGRSEGASVRLWTEDLQGQIGMHASAVIG